jgi:polar amino acid transport system permease protein
MHRLGDNPHVSLKPVSQFGAKYAGLAMNYQFQFDAVFQAWPLLAKGTWITIQLSLTATVLGLCVAIFGAWAKTSGPGWLRFIVNAYIELVRNTPFLVQLFFFFFALPALGLRWSAYAAALVAMVVNLGAYATEILRAGIESIPKGQIEAGLALNMKRHQVFRFIILKPALKAIYPALTSQFILLMLSSAVVSAISADDLTSVAANLQSQTFRSFEIYIVVAVIYLALALAFSALFKLVYRLALAYPDRR